MTMFCYTGRVHGTLGVSPLYNTISGPNTRLNLIKHLINRLSRDRAQVCFGKLGSSKAFPKHRHLCLPTLLTCLTTISTNESFASSSVCIYGNADMMMAAHRSISVRLCRDKCVDQGNVVGIIPILLILVISLSLFVLLFEPLRGHGRPCRLRKAS